MRGKRGQILIVSALSIIIVLISISWVLNAAYLNGLNLPKSDFRQTVTQVYFGARGALALSLADASKRMSQRERIAPPSPYHNSSGLELTQSEQNGGLSILEVYRENAVNSYPVTGLSVNFLDTNLECNWSELMGSSRAVTNISIGLLNYGFEGFNDQMTIEFTAEIKGMVYTEGNRTSFIVEFLGDKDYPLDQMSKTLVTVYFELFDNSTYLTPYSTFTKANLESFKYIGGMYVANFTIGFPGIDYNLDFIETEIGTLNYNDPEYESILLDTMNEIQTKYDTYRTGNRSQPWLQSAWAQLYDIRPLLDSESPYSWVLPSEDTTNVTDAIDRTLGQLRPRIRVVALDFRGITVSAYGELEEVDLGPVILNERVTSTPGGDYNLIATVDDSLGGNSPVSRVEYFISNSSSSIPMGASARNMSASDGTFDEPVENVNTTISVSWLYPTDNYVWIHAQDANGVWSDYVKLKIPSLLHLTLIDTIEIDYILMQGRSSGSGSFTNYWVEATVKIVDDDGVPVNGATVQGRWWGSYDQNPDTATALGGGEYMFETDHRRYSQWPPSSGDKIFNLQITSVRKTGYAWTDTPPSDWLGLTPDRVWISSMASTLSCSAYPTGIMPGQSVTVSGSLEPDLDGRTVTLTFTKPDSSTDTRTTTTGASGAYTYSYTPNELGSWSVVASWPGDEYYDPASSSTIPFTVANPINITITSSPSGTGYLTIDGSPITTPQTFSWVPGSTHNLNAISPVSGGANMRYAFDSWSDGGAQAHTYTVPSSASTVTATYRTQYQVTFQQTGVDSSSSGTVLTVGGTTRTRSQLPYTSWFDNGTAYAYSDPVSSSTTGKRFHLTSVTGQASPITGPATITGNYQIQYQLVINTNFGTVTPPSGGWYSVGSSVQIQATAPSAGAGERYNWNGWTGSGSGSYSGANNPATVTMNAPITETASWTHQYQVSFAVNPVGSGSTNPTGTGWYNAGSSIPISASANSGYAFSIWSATGSITITSPSSASTTATIGGTGTITANFGVQTTLLNDGFEGSPWNANWDTTASLWARVSDYRHGGSYAAKSSDGSEGNFACDPLNTFGATSVTVRFWYRLDDTEDTDLVLSYYNGASWVTITNLGGGNEDTWLQYTATITDSQYFKPDFRIRLTSSLGLGENVWIDDVLITKIS